MAVPRILGWSQGSRFGEWLQVDGLPGAVQECRCQIGERGQGGHLALSHSSPRDSRRYQSGRGTRFQSAPNPGPVSIPVAIEPSVTWKIPGNLASHGALAAGTYCRAFASMAATPGTCAAKP